MGTGTWWRGTAAGVALALTGCGATGSQPAQSGEQARAVGAEAPATEARGRLPPPVIQRTVRQHFSVFRKCYEVGLGRDKELNGRVIARFVIGKEGRVTNVSDHGSSLPDSDVVSCVLQRFYDLKFPAPEGGGIVTVVYPIMLAPSRTKP